MMDTEMRMLELAGQGFECSQIIMLMGLDMAGLDNPDLIRAVSGLNGGMGRSGKACGCLTSGACVLGLLTGKGEAEELEDSRSRELIQEYVQWFEENIGGQFGGEDCTDIIQGDYSLCMTVCRPILMECLEKLAEMIEANELI